MEKSQVREGGPVMNYRNILYDQSNPLGSVMWQQMVNMNDRWVTLLIPEAAVRWPQVVA